MFKVLNNYAGIGGNRKEWPKTIIRNGKIETVEITAVENNPVIAKIYQDFFPNDKVVIADVHEYLLKHFREFDFIWSSPPCQTHSRLALCNSPTYINLTLWQEIIF